MRTKLIYIDFNNKRCLYRTISKYENNQTFVSLGSIPYNVENESDLIKILETDKEI